MTVNKKERQREDFLTEAEAQALTGYKRTQLYVYRRGGKIAWTCADTGKQVLHLKSDLLRFTGVK